MACHSSRKSRDSYPPPHPPAPAARGPALSRVPKLPTDLATRGCLRNLPATHIRTWWLRAVAGGLPELCFQFLNPGQFRFQQRLQWFDTLCQILHSPRLIDLNEKYKTTIHKDVRWPEGLLVFWAQILGLLDAQQRRLGSLDLILSPQSVHPSRRIIPRKLIQGRPNSRQTSGIKWLRLGLRFSAAEVSWVTTTPPFNLA